MAYEYMNTLNMEIGMGRIMFHGRKIIFLALAESMVYGVCMANGIGGKGWT
jgi:hypothetical protein